MAEQSSEQFDLVVIGGGPAGYVGAIRAAQLGMKVACVERGQLGGVCLNWGCIPTKTLLASAEFYHRLKHDAAGLGIETSEVKHNWDRIISRSRGVAGNLNRGIAGLFKKHKITHVSGSARIAAPGKVEVLKVVPGSESSWDPKLASAAAKGAGLDRTLLCKNIMIATGAIARTLPGVEYDGERVLHARDAMSLKEQPRSLIIIGGGAIGVEFAYFYNAFGTKVTIIEMIDRLLPIEDAEVSKALEKSYKAAGIEVRTGMKTMSVKKSGTGVEVAIAPATQPGQPAPSAATAGETLSADKVLVAIGVKGNYEGLFDAKLGIEIFKDHIKATRPAYQTSVKGIYAVGDVNGPPWLAHVASDEAIVCVEQLAGLHPHPIDYDSIPGCTYCQPQVASVGHTEAKCKELGLAYKVGKFPFMASGKAQALGHTEGFIKIISDDKHGEILGVHMIGDNVTELIAEMVLAKSSELTVDEVIAAMHAHPTLSEAVHEAALGTRGRMIHF